MAIIQATKTFEGSDLTTSTFGKIFKDGVNVLDFRNAKYANGVWLFICPPYKKDSRGNGVSWKKIEVRDNFGVETKEKFVIGPNCPVSYFANQCKLKYKEYAAIIPADPAKGQKYKGYPPHGRVTVRVIYNVALFSDMAAGVHACDIPLSGAAEKLDLWSRQANPDGSARPPFNDAKASYLIMMQLKKEGGTSGNPWEVTIDNSKTYSLPVELADENYLYNLDEIIYYPPQEYLIEKLRSITPVEIFDECMKGWSGFKTQVAVTQNVAATTVAQPTPVNQFTPEPNMLPPVNIPKINSKFSAAGNSASQQQATPIQSNVPQVVNTTPTPPASVFQPNVPTGTPPTAPWTSADISQILAQNLSNNK